MKGMESQTSQCDINCMEKVWCIKMLDRKLLAFGYDCMEQWTVTGLN